MKMCRKVELLDKRMVLGVIVTQIVPQMMQLKKFYHHQIRRIILQQQNLWIAAKDSTQMILWELLVCLWKNTEKNLKSSKWMGMCQWGF